VRIFRLYTHTHTHMHVCVCVCVCIYIPRYVDVRKSCLYSCVSYFFITLYFSFSTKSLVSRAIFDHKQREFCNPVKRYIRLTRAKCGVVSGIFCETAVSQNRTSCRLNAGNWRNDGTCTDRESLRFLSLYPRGKSEELLGCHLVLTLNFDISRVFTCAIRALRMDHFCILKIIFNSRIVYVRIFNKFM